jgi:hypothetical protein
MWISASGTISVTEMSPTGTTPGTFSAGGGTYGIALDGVHMWATNFGNVVEL